jgi:hypothetical protein
MPLCDACDEFECKVCGHEACPCCEDCCDHSECIEWDALGSGTKKHVCVFEACPNGCMRGDRDPFLVACCPVCNVPWPTRSREDLHLVDHKCSGDGLLMDAAKCGANQSPTFFAPAGADASAAAANARRILWYARATSAELSNVHTNRKADAP